MNAPLRAARARSIAVVRRLVEVVWRLLGQPWLKGLFVLGVCLYGGRYYRDVVQKIYPVDTWLVWPLLQIWVGSRCSASAACASGT